MSLIQTQEDEVRYAKALVNPDKALRDQTLQIITKYVASLRQITDLEMLKLWKGLYYCMWLSDKDEIQRELATSLSCLIDKFSSKTLSLQYIRLFFRTLLREWYNLDQYRVNKFYTLIRLFLNRAFHFAMADKWSHETTSGILNILKEEVLTKRPNGIRNHISDIVFSELFQVTSGNISIEVFMTIIKPFLDIMVSGSDDSNFTERVKSAVFINFLEEHAGQNEITDSSQLFHCSITLKIQQELFDKASDESTSQVSRKRLFELHKSFGIKSGIPFVSDDDITIAKKASGKIVSRVLEGLKPVQVVETKDEKVSKKKKRNEDDSKDLVKIDDQSAKVKKIKTGDVEPVDSVQSVTEKEKGKPKKSALKSTQVDPKDMKKREVKKEIIQSDTQIENDADFISSSKFAGAKPGFVFHKGAKGLGYYKDNYVRQKAVRFSGSEKQKNKKK